MSIPKVSVLVPVYRTEPAYLRATALLGQAKQEGDIFQWALTRGESK